MSETERKVPRRFNVLRAIADNPNVSTGSIVRVLGISKPAVTIAVNTLEAAGLVERERNRFDRRLVKLRVTKAGAAAVQEGAA